MQVIIVSHTEFGSVRNQRVIHDRPIRGITEGIPNLAAVAEKHGVRVTFAMLPETVEHFPDVNDHEIALHIHPESGTPYQDQTAIGVGARFLLGGSHRQVAPSFSKTTRATSNTP